MDHWDPIGIGPWKDPAGPSDEYDHYAMELARMVTCNSSEAELEEYLRAAEEYIGVPRSESRIRDVAKLLAALEFREH